MEGVFDWVATYGYGAIFLLLVLGIVGLPIPDETLLVFCGYLISKGRLNATGAFFAALAGSWCGITTSFLLGRIFGYPFVHRFGRYVRLTDERLETVHQWFHRMGHWTLFVGYYIAGVRHFTAVVAGTSRLEFGTFVAYAWSGGLLWIATFLTLGYFLGENWRQIADLVHRWVGLASLLLLILAALYGVLRWRRNRV